MARSSLWPWKRAMTAGSAPAALFRRGVEQIGRDDVDVAAHRDSDIFELRVERDAEVGRERPGRGGPDEAVDLFAGKRGVDRRGIGGQRETNPNRRALVVLVFDFGFGQRGAVVDAPVDRLESFVDVALVEEIDKSARDNRLVGGLHREVRIVPAAQNAQAFEILALQIDPFFGVFAAGPADLSGRHLRFFGARVPDRLCVRWAGRGNPSRERRANRNPPWFLTLR